MKILAIETATEACSAALLIDDDRHTLCADAELFVEFELAPRQHTKLILPMVDKVLTTANVTLNDIDAIAFGRGPGAFTGLRIAAGVTQGLALAADLPVIPISTLAALAQQAYEVQQQTHSMVALDARINEVYWGCYVVQDGRAVLQGEEQVILPQSIVLDESLATVTPWVGVGSGWSVYADVLQQRLLVSDSHVQLQLQHIYAESVPSAASIARLAAYEFKAGNCLAVEDAQPVYLRDKVADTIAERERRKKQDARALRLRSES